MRAQDAPGGRLKPPRSRFWHSERPPCDWVPLPFPPIPCSAWPCSCLFLPLSLPSRLKTRGCCPQRQGPPGDKDSRPRSAYENGTWPRGRTGSAGRAAAAGKVGTLPRPGQWRSSTSSTARSSCSPEPSVVVARPFCDMKRSWFTRRSLTSACLKPSSSDSQR